MNKRIEQLTHKIAEKQLTDEEIFINLMKENKKSDKEIQNALKLYKAVMKDIKIDDKEILKNIVYKYEYQIDNVTVAVVTIKKNFIESTKYDDNYNMIQKKKTKYGTRIIIMDDVNCIDNIMLKNYVSKKQAISYANKLENLICNKSLDNLLDLVEKSI